MTLYKHKKKKKKKKKKSISCSYLKVPLDALQTIQITNTCYYTNQLLENVAYLPEKTRLRFL